MRRCTRSPVTTTAPGSSTPRRRSTGSTLGAWPGGSWEDLGDPLPSAAFGQPGRVLHHRQSRRRDLLGRRVRQLHLEQRQPVPRNRRRLRRRLRRHVADGRSDRGHRRSRWQHDRRGDRRRLGSRGRPARRLRRRPGGQRSRRRRRHGPGDDERHRAGQLRQGDRNRDRSRSLRRTWFAARRGDRVRSADFTVETDEAGLYEWWLAEGTYPITVSADGYVTQTGDDRDHRRRHHRDQLRPATRRAVRRRASPESLELTVPSG